jgi:hypothetical protein
MKLTTLMDRKDDKETKSEPGNGLGLRGNQMNKVKGWG